MDVSINGTQVLSHFDPATAAGATFKAVAPEFTAIADGSGNITLAVSASSGAADPNLALNAIEILTPVTLVGVTSFTYDRNGSTVDVESPAGLFTTYAWDAASRLSSTLFPGGGRVTETYRFDDMRVAQSSGTEVRTFIWAEGEVLALRGSAPSASTAALYQIDCGSASSVSPYAADSHFSGGRTFSTSATFDLSGVTDPAPQAVYQTCRTGNSCSYALPGLTPGAFYQLRFHFDEPIWMAPGQRPMDVFINGVKVISGFDPATQAGGSFKAVVAEVIAQPHASGVLAISVVSSPGAIDPNLALCAIEVWSLPVAADFSELFTHRPGQGACLLRAVGTNSAGASLQRHYHLDALGSVEAITGSSQSVETTYRTDAWGNVLSGSAQDNPAIYLGGLGYWNEPTLGLDYVRARWLNTTTGSWLSVDPVPTEPKYRYANNGPIFRVDPSGTQIPNYPVIEGGPQSPTRSYVVQHGDTLQDIAKRTLGMASRWREIAPLYRNHDPNQLFVGEQLKLPGKGPKYSATQRVDDDNSKLPARLAKARGFLFVLVEELPEIGVGGYLIRKQGLKVAVIPHDFSIMPHNPLANINIVEHVMGTRPGTSNWISASEMAHAIPMEWGQPYLINTAEIHRLHGHIEDTRMIVAALGAKQRELISEGSPADVLQTLIDHIKGAEGEAAIRMQGYSGIPRSALSLPSDVHSGYIGAAEALWRKFPKEITREQLEQRLTNLNRSYSQLRALGRVGRVLSIVGVVLTLADLGYALHQSFDLGSWRPIVTSVAHSTGSIGGALSGAKIGAVIGAEFGIETGPGLLVSGVIGSIIFGILGYFGSDWAINKIPSERKKIYFPLETSIRARPANW